MFKRILFLLVTVAGLGQLLQAQVTTSSITGTIREKGGQPLAGATVSALYQPAGTRYNATSGTAGQFTINNMQTGGPYQITVTYVGFDPQTYNDVFIQLGEASVINIDLVRTERALEQVVVTTTGRNNILNSRRTGAATSIGTREFQRLPTISRSLNDFTRLTPQANGQAIGGGNSRQNFITVDGSDFNNTFGIGGNLPANGSPISLDALDELSVNIAPYDVRQSGFVGSAINSVTRSGTNTFNGSVYTFFRNEDQRGNTVKGTDFPLQRESFRQWGARVGGPIIKNKLFFFLSAETEKRILPGQQRFASTSPTGAGSYGAANPTIARPRATELDSVSAFLRDRYGYETGPYQGYDFESDQTKFLGRIDWNISSNHRLNIRYNQVEGKQPFFVSGSTSSTGLAFAPNFGRTDINALHFSNSNYFQENNFYSTQMELNSRFGTKWANTFRASYNLQDEPRSTNSAIFPFVDIQRDGQPLTSFGYEPFSLGNLREVKILAFTNNLTYNTGRNNFTLGFQTEHSSTRNGFQPLGMSYYRFNSFEDFRTGAKPTDFAVTFSLNPGYEQAFPSFKFAQYSAYLQDEITFSSKFRLTVGLRGDLTTYPDVDELRTNPLVAGLTFAGGTKIDTRILPDPKVMLSPRIGFNYDPYGDRSLQIRGGTGIFTGRVPFVWIVGQSGNSGMLQVTQNFNGVANTPGPFNADPRAYLPATPPPAGTIVPSTVTAFSEDFTLPQTWKSSLGMDVRLPGGIVGTIDAVFNRDINVLYSRNLNLAEPTALNIPGYPDNRLIYPSANQVKYLNPLTDGRRTTANPNPSTPVPNGDTRGTQQFNAIVSGNEDQGYYFSITGQLSKQFSRGLFATLAYTKSISDNLFDGNGDQPFNTWSLIQTVNGANNPQLAPASYVVPDRVIGTISYRKEYLKHLATTVSLFYEGSIQGRFSYTYTNDFNRDNQNNDLIYIPRDASEINFIDRPASTANNTPFVSAAEQSRLFFEYIDQDKYLRTRRGQYAERNGARLPWRNQFDFKFAQDVFANLGRKRNTLQFTVDIFNVGNLINSEWGVTQTTNASSILAVQSFAAPGSTARPTYWLSLDRGTPVRSTFRDNLTTGSTYFMQFGLRYLFGN